MAELSRLFTPDLEIRADSEGRTVTGLLVPFERVARVSDGGPAYDEMFRIGAFSRTINNGDVGRVKLLSQHNTRVNPLGRATLLREDAAGLYGEFKVSRTTPGDEALELVRDGALDSFSVGFRPIEHVKEGAVTVRTQVALRETSLVTFGAYMDARVTGIRTLDALTDDELAIIAERVAQTLRATTPDEDSEHDPATTPLADSEPSAQRAHVIAWNNFRASLIQRGIKA